MEPCPYTVGRCPLMKTCPKCKREFLSRSGMSTHQRGCSQPLDVEHAEAQHAHWKANHTHYKEQDRRRVRR
jgi:hypothetical protein